MTNASSIFQIFHCAFCDVLGINFYNKTKETDRENMSTVSIFRNLETGDNFQGGVEYFWKVYIIGYHTVLVYYRPLSCDLRG